MKKLFTLISLAIILVSCSKKKDDEPQPTSQPAVQRHVQYNIACTDCQVMYNNAQGQQVSEYHKNSNWSFSFDGEVGDVVLLFAYNTGSAPQGITACIKLNGDTLVTRTNYCPVSGYSFVTDTLK